jgi:hypothetical protein
MQSDAFFSVASGSSIRLWRRFGRYTLPAVITLCWPNSVRAQYGLGYVHPLFVTAAREPTPSDAATTARSLAMGGAHAITGLADDALACPANLLRSTGTDVVVSGGPFFYSRAEPANTPTFLFGQSGGFLTPTELQGTGSSAQPVGYGAVATRHPLWAAGAFFDATMGYEHQFDTRRPSSAQTKAAIAPFCK